MVKKEQVIGSPQTPGVYFFSAKGGSASGGKNKIIYVGKARNLKMRLLSYFRNDEADVKKRAMLEEAEKISWKELGSDIEALLTEASLIKKLRPKYNVLMRDDKQYFYVAFTREKFPKIFITHQPFTSALSQRSKVKSQKLDYVGPFTDGWAIKSVLKSLRRIFPYCQCSEKHSRPCQQANIGRCPGICCIKEKETERFFPDAGERTKKYKENIRTIKKILSGRHQSVMKKTIKEMEKASKGKNYERAAELRDTIKALENIFRHRPFLSRDEESWRQKGLSYLKTLLGLKERPRRIEFYDISNFQGKLAVGSMVVFTNGEPDKKEYKKFKVRMKNEPNDVAMIKEVLTRRLKHADWPKPDLIIVDGGKAQLNAAKTASNLQYPTSNIQFLALAKREEELYLPDGKVIKLKEGPEPLLHLLTSIRDEAHRFAISYHKKLRSKQIST